MVYREKGYAGMAEELEREAADAETIARTMGGPGTQAPRIKPCPGANGQACVRRKSVVRTERCPDCTLAHARARQTKRMAKASVPNTVACPGVDEAGCPERRQVKPGARCVDCEFAARKRQAGTEDPLMSRIRASAPPADAGEELDDDMRALDAALHAPQPAMPSKKTRGRSATGFNTFKPGTRQLPPKAVTPVDGQRNWWETAKPGEMTKTAEAERGRMSSSKEAKRVPGFVND